MSSINFYLDKPDRKTQCPILLSYISRGKRFRYYTKLKVEENLWDPAKQEVKKPKPGANEMNSILESLKESIKQIEREYLFKKQVLSIDQLRQCFDVAIGRQKSSDDFHSVFRKYLNVSTNTKTEGTVKALRYAYNKLCAFEDQSKYTLTFGSINKNFYDLYINFLINECKHLNNTVGRFIKVLKFFMNYATEIGINTNMQFRKFKVFDEEVDLIYLTNEEVMRLLHLPIENNRLNAVRENFCFECFTGLRFSDVRQIENVHIEGSVLKLKTQKTKMAITVPLNQYALQLVDRNRGKWENRPLPPCFSMQKTNTYLKELATLAEINDPVHIVKYSGSKRIDFNMLKHEVLTTHAARRTFITLSLEKGMRPEIVMQIVGIKKWETFKRYIKITDNAKIHEMNAKWNDKPILKAI
jgi:site-specific recombinase XerD